MTAGRWKRMRWQNTPSVHPSIYPLACRKLLSPQTLTRCTFADPVLLLWHPKAKLALSKHWLTQLLLPACIFIVPTQGWHFMSAPCPVFSILGGLCLIDITYTFPDSSGSTSGSVGDVGPSLFPLDNTHTCRLN